MQQKRIVKYRRIQQNTNYPEKKRGKLPKNQEEMSNLLGNMRNANKNNNEM